MVRSALSLALAALLGVAPCKLLRADTQPGIVISGDSSPELVRKLRAEALGAGFVVSDRERPDASTLAVITVNSPDRVLIEIAAEDTEANLSETFTRRAADGESFALRVVEELRARLVELELWIPARDPSATTNPATAPKAPETQDAPHPPAAVVAAAEPEKGVTGGATRDRGPAPDSPSATRSAMWLAAGLAGALPQGGMGATSHAVLGLRYEPPVPLAIDLLALLPLTGSEVSESQGTAQVGVGLYAAQVDYRAVAKKGWLLDAGLGAGLLAIAFEGEAVEPFVAKDDRLFAGVYYAEASTGHEFADWLRLRATLFGGLAGPRPVLVFDDEAVATWGRWFGGLSLRAELGLALGGRGSAP